MLYHCNFGPPLLGKGAELVAAVEELAPWDAAAVGDLLSWNRYAAPQAGRGEQVHFCRVRPAADGMASAMLVSPCSGNAARLSWHAATLPCFTLWKNQGGLADGYVTGLEPGTNYPNARSFEAQQGRVVPLAAGEGVESCSLIIFLGQQWPVKPKLPAASLQSRSFTRSPGKGGPLADNRGSGSSIIGEFCRPASTPRRSN